MTRSRSLKKPVAEHGNTALIPSCRFHTWGKGEASSLGSHFWGVPPTI